MTDSDPSDKPMRVVLENEDTFDVSFEQGTLDEAGIRVENAVPIEALEDLVERWNDGEYARKHDYHAQIGMQLAADELQALINDYTNE